MSRKASLSPHSRLELARKTHQARAPSEFEVRSGALRVLARMNRPVRRRFKRGPVVVLALLFLGSAAYAASLLSTTSEPRVELAPTSAGAMPTGTGPSTRATPVPNREVQRESETQSATNASRPQRTQGQGDEVPARHRLAESSRRPLPSRETERHGGTALGWSAVAQAMAANDYPRAERELQRLARSSDATTRVNAKLGLAQLALGRGDCKRALTLAKPIAAGGAGAGRRARRIVERCAETPRPSPAAD